MKQPNRDPFERLGDANPHPTRPLPPDVSARIWSRIQEDTMDAPTTTGRRSSALPRWALALAGVTTAVAVLAVAITLSRPAAGGPSVALGDGMGICVEIYSPETLRNRDYAFAGVLTAIEPIDDGLQSRISFSVERVFSGSIGETVTLTGSGMTEGVVASEGGPVAHVGDRLLISGDGGFAWPCGFSRTWSAEMADEWADATR